MSVAELKTKIVETIRKFQEKDSTRLSLPESIVIEDTLCSLEELSIMLENADDINQTLITFLQQRWEKITKCECPSYTAIPTDDISEICCNIANILAKETQKPAFSFLMPGICNHFNQVDGVDLAQIPVTDIIRLFIISDDFESMIPISLFQFINLDNSLDELTNPYTLKPLTSSEKRRLIKHSSTTESIILAQANYCETVSQGTTLYGALQKLILTFKLGGEHGLHGGSAGAATSHVYQGLKTFQDYWAKLTKKQQEEVCKIESFKNLIEKNLCNLYWEDDCVEETAKSMRKEADQNRELFTNISLNEASKQDLLKGYQQKFEQLGEKLNSVLTAKDLDQIQYVGRDRFFFE